ncbi:hypothetical protein VTK73DRAFT_3177 [Phialemonium thermophilum]|uniref:Ubiquitin carboxyl-terminal hydrolase n=1 Tax=Phialemonium thermophilum TaxID=223376 RepID=A0ABR3X0Z0_9PEZI
MAGFFNKLKGTGTGPSAVTSNALPKHKKEEPAVELTPLEKMLQNAGPLREDGSDKFFGLENFGNTCYCNSIVQALYYCESFRDNVVNYPPSLPSETVNGKTKKVNVKIRPPPPPNGPANVATKGQKSLSASQTIKQRQAINAGQVGPGQQGIKPEDKPDTPEYKKKQAMIKGPVLELAEENSNAYGMQECTFTGLKDIFTALIESDTRTGVLSPQRFLDIFKRDNEMFRNSMHQDAHEFYGLVLNDVISSVEANAKALQAKQRELEQNGDGNGAVSVVQKALNGSQSSSGARLPGTGWVHDIFEGVLTSETKCLTCETTSQRDETFLDLSIDLEEHSSVTSCLRKFSAEEMLCERNKFHCDHCGGLQEAEKRMKIKRLPKVLALHLKRFKYTEDYSRLQKLFHRVVYPYYLRMFNTTDDAEDPDRMYELYAVVVHIGSNAYHGHYVSVIKTQDRGWLLFDDEMVEPVDKHFVRNFFGDKPGTACAYVLFYQETTFEKMREEQEAEGLEEVKLASQTADLAQGLEQIPNGTHPLSRLNSQPVVPVEDHDSLVALSHARTAPVLVPPSPDTSTTDDRPAAATSADSVAATRSVPETAATPAPAAALPPPTKTKEEKEREKKELKAQEKMRKAAEKEQAKLELKKELERRARMRDAQKEERDQLQRVLEESKRMAAEEEKKRKREAAAGGGSAVEEGSTTTSNGTQSGGGGAGLLNRANRGSKSMARKSFAFLAKSNSNSSDGKAVGEAVDKTESKSSVEYSAAGHQNGSATTNSAAASPAGKAEKPRKERFSFGLGRKRSDRFAS